MESFFLRYGYVVLGAAALGLAWAVVLTVWHRRLLHRIDVFFRGGDGETLEGRIDKGLARMEKIEKSYSQLAKGLEMLHGRLQGAVQHVGLVRFNAIQEMRGEQSFALALLDEKKSGVILLSLLTREGTRLYTKRIAEGKPSHTLTPEEKHALEEALANP